MSEPFLGEIRMMGFNFAPRGWAFCDGQILPINQNQSLYSLLGTTYGGDGRTSFALPDLRGRAPIHVGSGHQLGQKAGEEVHFLSLGELPQHSHAMQASSASGDVPSPDGTELAAANNLYRDGVDLTSLAPDAIGSIGASHSHENRQPYLAVTFCIALQGLFPSRD